LFAAVEAHMEAIKQLAAMIGDKEASEEACLDS
jgi:hypothetical protein